MSNTVDLLEINSIIDVRKHIQGLKAIVFDLDDTLYSEKEYVKSGYRAVAKLFPNVVNAEERLWQLFLNGKPAIDAFLAEQGIDDINIKQQCLQAYRFQEPEIHLYDGVKELLVELKQSYKLGLITDGRPEGQRAKIKALDIEQYFDYIIVTDELGGVECRKPNSMAFEMMQTKLGVAFNEMCYIGDNTKKDFIAPQKFGMRSIWFRNQDGIYYRERL